MGRRNSVTTYNGEVVGSNPAIDLRVDIAQLAERLKPEFQFHPSFIQLSIGPSKLGYLLGSPLTIRRTTYLRPNFNIRPT